jgi:hypothetical protein
MEIGLWRRALVLILRIISGFGSFVLFLALESNPADNAQNYYYEKGYYPSLRKEVLHCFEVF